MSSIRLENLVKKFGSVTSVSDVNLEIEDGQFVIFVGPSGCGKTTTLRMVAGLEKPTSGHILFDGQVVNHVEPAQRNVAMVFQNFALYPHMTARENITLSLRVKKENKEDIEKRLSRVAEMLNIAHLLDRRPNQLSGGEKQRVAVGRAIIRNPNVLLMDEPLSNLDAKLRLTMRAELKTLVREIGVTTVYVTHDQVEAMTLGDVLVVMNKGHIQQIDSPMNIYNNPKNMFVAEMIGSPPINFFRGGVVGHGGGYRFCGNGFTYPLGSGMDLQEMTDREMVLGVRPNSVRFAEEGEEPVMEGTAVLFEQHGTEAFLHVSAGPERVLLQVDPERLIEEKTRVGLRFNDGKVFLFDGESGLRVGTPA